MREAERLTMSDYGIPGRVLMETAGRACSDIILKEFGISPEKKAVVVAGKGNNGGDGYVIARCLARWGWKVRVFVVGEQNRIGGDAAANLKLVEPSKIVYCPKPGDISSRSHEFAEATIIVDALFGIGLNNVVTGIHAEAIETMNSCGRPIVAVDIASGIDASSGRVLGAAVHAEVTVTFGFAKLGHILYPGRSHTGKLIPVDIGIPDEVMGRVCSYTFMDETTARSLVRTRDRCGHKGDYGHCLLVAGSTGKTGAASLSANSAVRSGAGLVTLAVPASLNPILEVKTTEAMTLPLDDAGKGFLGDKNGDAILGSLTGKDAMAIGPGISRDPETVLLIQKLLRESALPLVIDADGLNALAEDVSVLLQKKTPALVLTPHPGEMSRLTGLSIDQIEYDRITVARDFAGRYGVFVILKGAGTIVASPGGDVSINGSGNPGMASGGMGDVLTGVIVSLLGQGYPVDAACMLGVYLHGFAADLVAEEKGEVGITATDVQERLPYALKRLHETG